MESNFITENMTTETNLIQDIATQLISLSPELLVIVALNALGYACGKLIPGKYIPLCVVLSGAGIYPMVAKVGEVDPTVRNPIVTLILRGVLLGLLAWLVHAKFLSKIEEWIAAKKETPPET